MLHPWLSLRIGLLARVPSLDGLENGGQVQDGAEEIVASTKARAHYAPLARDCWGTIASGDTRRCPSKASKASATGAAAAITSQRGV